MRVSDALHADLMTLLKGLCILKLKGLIYCSVEGDFGTVISWMGGKSRGSWRLHHLICEARSVLKDLNVVLLHVSKEKNALTNKITQVECEPV